MYVKSAFSTQLNCVLQVNCIRVIGIGDRSRMQIEFYLFNTEESLRLYLDIKILELSVV